MLDEFLERLNAAKVPPGWEWDHLFISNANEDDNLEFYRRLCELPLKEGDRWMVSHIGFKHGTTARKRVADAYNVGRGIDLYLQPDYPVTMTLEQDVLLRGNEIVDMFAALRKGRIVTGVTEYERVQYTPEEIAAMKKQNIQFPEQAPEAVMIFRYLSVKRSRYAEWEYHAPLVIGRKQGWVPVPVAILKDTGPLPKYTAYLRSEMLRLKESGVREVQVEGCALGCMLMHTEVLKNVVFRFDPSNAAYCDMWFSIDARKAGYEIFCLPHVWPEHKAQLHADEDRGVDVQSTSTPG